MVQELSISLTTTGGSSRCNFLLDLYHSGCASRIYSGASTLCSFFINDIVNGIDSNIRLFTDDTSLLSS